MNWKKQFDQSPDGLLWATMAALPTTEAEALTWQRVAQVMQQATPGAQWMFDGLRKWLAQQKACPDLRFSWLSAAGLATAGTGQLIGSSSTARLWALYVRKALGASVTAAYVRVTDDSTDAALSGLTAGSRIVIPLGAVGSAQPGQLYEGLYLNPAGLPLANGLRVAANTTCDGLTISAALDSADGFVLTSN